MRLGIKKVAAVLRSPKALTDAGRVSRRIALSQEIIKDVSAIFPTILGISDKDGSVEFLVGRSARLHDGSAQYILLVE